MIIVNSLCSIGWRPTKRNFRNVCYTPSAPPATWCSLKPVYRSTGCSAAQRWDQQVGALVAESETDMMIFFWDPLNAVPHGPDVKALLRLATAWDSLVATDRSTADFLISYALSHQDVVISIPDYQRYLAERLLS